MILRVCIVQIHGEQTVTLWVQDVFMSSDVALGNDEKKFFDINLHEKCQQPVTENALRLFHYWHPSVLALLRGKCAYPGLPLL